MTKKNPTSKEGENVNVRERESSHCIRESKSKYSRKVEAKGRNKKATPTLCFLLNFRLAVSLPTPQCDGHYKFRLSHK